MSENWNIQVSPKLPDGTLVNLRAESPDQMGNLLTYIEQNAQAITSAIAVLTAAGNAANAGLTTPQRNATSGYIQAAPTQPPQQSWGQPQAAGAPTGPRPSCIHGEHKWVPAGVSKNPPYKPYSGFFTCPAPRGQQCPKNAA